MICDGQKYCSKHCNNRARSARREAGLAGTIIPQPSPTTPPPSPVIQSLKTGSLASKDESLDLLITAERQKWPIPKLPTYDLAVIELLLAGINSPLTTPSRRLRYVQAYNASYGRLTGLLKYNLDVDKYELEVKKLEMVKQLQNGDNANPEIEYEIFEDNQDETPTPHQVGRADNSPPSGTLPIIPPPGIPSDRNPPIDDQQ